MERHSSFPLLQNLIPPLPFSVLGLLYVASPPISLRCFSCAISYALYLGIPPLLPRSFFFFLVCLQVFRHRMYCIVPSLVCVCYPYFQYVQLMFQLVMSRYTWLIISYSPSVAFFYRSPYSSQYLSLRSVDYVNPRRFHCISLLFPLSIKHFCLSALTVTVSKYQFYYLCKRRVSVIS